MKQNSPSSNNSGTSSETSETQSVEENNTSGLGTPDTGTPRSTSSTRSTKFWRRMKESNSEKEVSDAKRPPWRAVSVSTLPKPDKNALLRAKLLDASRRMRAAKSTVSCQTDIEPTILVKDVNFDVQSDLIDYNDVGILTDGAYMMKREGSQEFILTYSVSQMTDVTPVSSTETQTLLPKIPGDDFMKAYYSYDQSIVDQKDLNAIERKLVIQARDIRDSRKLQLQQKALLNKNDCNNSFSGGEDSLSETDTDTTETKTTIEEVPISEYPQRTLRQPTYASWQFNYNDRLDTAKNFPPYRIMRSRLAGGEAKLLVPPKKYFSDDQEYKAVNINAFASNAIDELILESNNLVDIIEDIKAERVAREISTVCDNAAPTFKPKELVSPTDYWLPIIEKQEKELAYHISTLKHPHVRKVQKLKLT